MSTETPAWWGGGRRLAVVPDDAAREGAARSSRPGAIGGLGKGERVYAVRFVGDTGYVVTFRQVDPLYTVDLANPARPRVLGELKIPGYSAYLHPIGEDLLLGVGQDATTRAARSARRSRSSTSPTSRTRRACQAPLGRAGRRRSPTTTPSSTGRDGPRRSRSSSAPSASGQPRARDRAAGQIEHDAERRYTPGSAARWSSATRC